MPKILTKDQVDWIFNNPVDVDDAGVLNLIFSLRASQQDVERLKGWHEVVTDCEKVLNLEETATSPLNSNLANSIRDKISEIASLRSDKERLEKANQLLTESNPNYEQVVKLLMEVAKLKEDKEAMSEVNLISMLSRQKEIKSLTHALQIREMQVQLLEDFKLADGIDLDMCNAEIKQLQIDCKRLETFVRNDSSSMAVWSEKKKEEIASLRSELEAYKKAVREIPQANGYSADRYDTDDKYVLHLWDTVGEGHSFDIYVLKSEVK